jgi:membrane protease YdiL (CAAX protease family)
MRPLLVLLSYVGAVFLGGALLAPWLYHLAQTAAPHHRWVQSLAAHPFSAFVNRSLLICAIAGLWPLMRALKVTALREIGLVRLRGERPRLLKGFLLAGGITVACGGRVINHSDPVVEYFKHLLSAALAATAVALLEETLFRGGVFGSLRRVFDWRFALLLSSMIYAIVHFFQSAPWPDPVTWSSGLQLLPRMAAGFLDPQRIFPGFLNLTLVGALLALAYHRTGNLWFSIGLHGGWVFWIKFNSFLTSAVPGTDRHFWGSSRLTDGWMVCLILLATLACTPWLFGERKAPRHEFIS